MDLEGKNAARSVTATRADGKGKAGGSNAQKPPPRPESLLDVQPDNDNSQSSAGPESLLTEPTRIRPFRHGYFTSMLRFST
jgi:hypothetical protein